MAELKNEQKSVIEHENGNILVSASAGSGKTFVMIKRLIRLILEDKTTINQIMAVTFTDAAALDMKDKLKQALIEEHEKGEKDLSEQIMDVATADISTLHSFCSRLIRTYFFAAEVSPDYSIADATQSDYLKHESIEKVFKQLYDTEDEGFRDLLDKYSWHRSDDRLKSIILSMYDYAVAESNPVEFIEKIEKRYTDSGLDGVIKEYKGYLDDKLVKLKNIALNAYNYFNENALEKSKLFCEGIVCDIDGILKSDLYGIRAYENYKRDLSFERGLEGEALFHKQNVALVRDEIKGLISRYIKHVTSKERDASINCELLKTITELKDVIKKFADCYTELKREENVLDFNDLEHIALKILQDETIRKTVTDKYKYLFVDEYQDINGVQEEIIRKLSNNNLFMVGDVKQSIYGFRGCRPEIFAKKFESMKTAGERTVNLNYNFRCAENIIDTVNEIFGYSMTEDYYGLDYANTSNLISGGIYPKDARGRATLHFLQKEKAGQREKETPRIYDVLREVKEPEDEDNKIASLVTTIINEELKSTYYDVKTKDYRQVTYGDVAILTRNKDNAYVSKLVDGLIRRNIPVSSEVKQNICATPEIQTLIYALRLIDCFKDDVPLCCVLKSAFGNFTEEELAEIALYYKDNKKKEENGGFYDAYAYYLNNGTGELKDKLIKFDGYFSEVRFLADFLGAKEILSKLISDSGYESYVLSERLGETKLKRIKRFLELCSSSGKNLTVSEMLKKIDNSKDAFEMSECAEENTIKVMTIHASKGLEFPVVIVCGLERNANAEEENAAVLFDREYGFATLNYDKASKTYSETLMRGLVKERMKNNRLKEELRLFYVALTRARYSLHLTYESTEDDRKELFSGATKFIDYVPKSIPSVQHGIDEFEKINLQRDRKSVIVGSFNEDGIREMQKQFAFTYRYLEDTVLPLKSSVTANLNYDGEKNTAVYSVSTGIKSGTYAHKLLQYFNFDDRTKYLEQAKSILTEEELNSIDIESIGKVVNSAVFDKLQNKSLYREQSFIVKVPARMLFDTNSTDGVVVQGVIDLLVVEGNEATVIDYKYSVRGKDSLIKEYKKQLELYAYAVETVLGLKVKEKIIVNILTGETVSVI